MTSTVSVEEEKVRGRQKKVNQLVTWQNSWGEQEKKKFMGVKEIFFGEAFMDIYKSNSAHYMANVVYDLYIDVHGYWMYHAISKTD